ncbi:hypothetical protein [Paludisphaera mucosa]|uniref:DUF3352 domain-containing protein n=1 Tax=Paludisphaera mucosa TaxID=3030827 RepID=A0ABT6FBV8_9BACT|nr:hypothetical protein [Paludisphaera mucosa]MDG3005079.1 hypothetical protein [Paludisphaera mucosa]
MTCLVLVLASAARGEEATASADALLKLVPAEAGAVLAVDDLRDRWAAIAGSRLARDVQELPAFRAWLDSRSAGDFLEARDRIMGFLQTSHREIRDEILGDAVVLAILPPEDPALDASQSRGLMLLKARDPKLLRRLVDQINAVQKQNGELAEVVEVQRAGVGYFTRRFPEGSGQIPESFAIFPDGVFAFSNAEPLIQEVIDRKAGPSGEGNGKGRGASFVEAAGFAEASKALSGRPLARAFVSPDFVARVFAGLPPAADPELRRVVDAGRAYLGAMSRAGAALVVEDAKIQLQLVQAFKAGSFRRLGGSILSAYQPGVERPGPGPRLMALPATAVAAASLRVDVAGMYRFLMDLVPAKDQARIAKLESIAGVLLLGQDLRNRILPTLGPRLVVYADAADLSAPKRTAEASVGGFPFPIVASIEIDEEAALDRDGGVPRASTAAAVHNALNGVLTALALDEKRVPATANVVVRDGVAALDVPYPFAFAIDPQGRFLSVGTSIEAVARYLQAGARADAGARFRGFQAAAFPDCEAFACVDLAALGELAVKHKDRLTAAVARRNGRPAEDVARDLDQLMGLIRLFDAAYLAGRVDVPGVLVDHRLGLLARRAGATPATP